LTRQLRAAVAGHLSRIFKNPKKTLKWREVQPGTYKVLEIHEHGQGKFGPSVVLNLESKNGTTFFVWVTPSIVYALKKRKKLLSSS